MNLKISAWSAIISGVIWLTSFVLSQGIKLDINPLWFSILSLPFSIIVIGGYLQLAKNLKIKFLRVMSYIYLIITVVDTIYFIFLFPYTSTIVNIFMLISLLYVFIFGTILLVFGISVLKLRSKFGGLATSLGVVYIIVGFLFMTLIFESFGAFLSVVTCILESILFFKASSKY